MKQQRYCYQAIYWGILVLGMLAACQPQRLLLPTPTTPFTTPISPTALLPTPLPSSTPSQAPSSPTPETHYQLTFLAECEEKTQCMYAIDMGCLESEQPCMGKPTLLFKVSMHGQGPRFPILLSNWSPDGQKVVVEAKGLRGKPDVFVGDWNGKNWVNLTNSPTYEGSPVWSPDGLSIAYIAKSGEDPNYYTQAFAVRLEDQSVSQLFSTLDLKGVGALYWTPDGKQVAFEHFNEQEGYYQWFLANPDGSNLKQLTFEEEEEEEYALYGFSPDGHWLLYETETGTDSQMASNIYRIRVDGSERIAIAEGINGFATDFAWSPIGNWIAFTLRIDWKYDIYLIRTDGSKLIRITESNIDEVSPAWRVVSP